MSSLAIEVREITQGVRASCPRPVGGLGKLLMLCVVRLKFWAVLLPLSAVNLQHDAAFDPSDCTHARTYRADPTLNAGVAGSIKLLIDLDRLSGVRAPAKGDCQILCGVNYCHRLSSVGRIDKRGLTGAIRLWTASSCRVCASFALSQPWRDLKASSGPR